MLVGFCRTSSATTEPSTPQLSAICRKGAVKALKTMSTPIFSSPLALDRDLARRLAAAQQGHAAAGQDAFLDRRAGGVQGVLDAGLLLLHVGFGLGTDRDDRHAAGQLGQPLLQLLAIVVAVGLLDLASAAD